MKTLLPPLLLGLLALSARATEPDDQLLPAPRGKSLKLIWHDEFDGDRLDESKWEPRPDGKRKGGWWSRKAISLDGEGHLVITTFMDGDKPTDGCVWTKGKFEHVFGYYVARVKFQKEPGHWTAFWMNGDGIRKVGDGGRDGTEIDIMEKPWLNDRVQHTFHWDGYGEHHKSEGKVVKVPGVMEGWHTFGLLWLPDEYTFYVDGQGTWRSKAGGVCQVPQYMLLSDEIGPWAGDITKAKLPDRFLVDYVRVYDLVDVYYKHSCNHNQDPEWEKAVGYHAPNKEQFARNIMDIVGHMGERYKQKIKTWWFDSPYSLDPRGPHNSVTTDMTGFQFPWERFTVVTKRGYPKRLVTYNAGVAQTFLYTTHQDYWAGELVNLDTPAKSRYLDNGLQWFGGTCIEDRRWVHTKLDTPIPAPLYTDEQVIGYVHTCNSHQAPMTFNVGIYQDGTLAESSVEQLHRLNRALRS